MNRNRGNRVYVCGWVCVVCLWKVRIEVHVRCLVVFPCVALKDRCVCPHKIRNDVT